MLRLNRDVIHSIFIAVVVTTLSAHEDPATVADSLTHDIEHLLTESEIHDLNKEKQEELADLYFLRAHELSVMGKKKKSHADLLKYTELKPEDYMGLAELAKVEPDVKKRSHYLEKALKLVSSDNEKSSVLFALAEHSYTIEKYDQALEYCSQSLALAEEGHITTVLFKGHILWKLGLFDKRVELLAKAMKINPSYVLKHAWIDAKLDAGQSSDVKLEIHKQMEDSRFKSSWLIRAARCERKGSKLAQQYAQAAIDEILIRLHPERPDMTLQMDLVRAYSLLNEEGAGKQAQQYLDRLKSAEFIQWEIVELVEMVKLKE